MNACFVLQKNDLLNLKKLVDDAPPEKRDVFVEAMLCTCKISCAVLEAMTQGKDSVMHEAPCIKREAVAIVKERLESEYSMQVVQFDRSSVERITTYFVVSWGDARQLPL